MAGTKAASLAVGMVSQKAVLMAVSKVGQWESMSVVLKVGWMVGTLDGRKAVHSVDLKESS